MSTKTLNLQANTDAIKAALVETEILNEEIEEVDNERAIVEQKVEQLEVESQQSFNKIVQGVRKTATLVIGLAQATGGAFDEIYKIGIEAALVTAELLADVAAAESLTLAGIFTASAKISLIVALIARANQLRQGKTEQAQRTQGIITAITPFTY